MPNPEKGRRKVFVSYSHRDAKWLKRLQVHLRDLERRGLVELWDDTKIRPGDEWRGEIRAALDSAAVAVLLISADFIGSDFIAENELPPLLAAAESDGVRILPLILSASLFETIEDLARFQSINSPSMPLNKLGKGKQEEYLVTLSKAVLQAVGEEGRGAASSEPAKGRQIFDVAFSRNRFFTGRGEILEQLRTEFQNGERVQALNGLGGIGKTQTALEYAYLHRENYKVILWGKAHSRESLVANFAAMAILLSLPQKDVQDQNEAASAARCWLENNGSWLLILDNADDIPMTREFIPSGETGHVLLTTRARALGDIGERNDLEKMNPSEGALFLLRRLKELKKDQPLESAPEELRKQAEALSRAVDGLPLALDQAAAFIDEMPSSLEEYQTLYQTERKELLKRRGRLAEDHPSVAVTFSLAFKKVAEDNRAAADLLRICAFLEADAIPEEVFSEGAKKLGKALSSLTESTLSLTNAIEEAGRFSLLHRHPEARTVSIHRLVQVVLRDEMDNEAKRKWGEWAVRAVNSTFPQIEYSSWHLCDRIISHAQVLASVINENDFVFPEASLLLNQTGTYLNKRAHYTEAEPFLRAALTIREKVLGKEHPDIATSLHNLATLCDNRDQYVEAESFYTRALAIREKVLGLEHPDVAQTLNNLAVVYKNQGKCIEAEPLYYRALAIREKVFGPEHPYVVNSLNNLVLLYDRQERYAEAESLCHRALAISDKVLDAEHPWVAQSLNNLAGLYHKQGKFIEAEPLYNRALFIREKVLGMEHSQVANILNDLGGLCWKQGKYVEAETLYRRALAIREKVFGAWHSRTRIVLEEYIALLREMGREEDIRELESRIRSKPNSSS